MAQRLSRPDQTAHFQAMAEILGWDRRRKYLALIKGLENLAQFNDAASINEPTDVLNVIRDLANDFEACLPQTSDYFVGLWRPPHKDLSFGFADTHRSLDKDAPLSRPIQRIGRIISQALVGGLHHQYVRI